jgi:hypothetical protein
MERAKTKYAVACSFTHTSEDYEDEEGFFVTFNTVDEDEAIRLASCICGDRAIYSLVLITEHGHVFPLM